VRSATDYERNEDRSETRLIPEEAERFGLLSSSSDRSLPTVVLLRGSSSIFTTGTFPRRPGPFSTFISKLIIITVYFNSRVKSVINVIGNCQIYILVDGRLIFLYFCIVIM